MENYLKIISDSFTGYWNYLITEISAPSWSNYFYWLIGISLFAWGIELIAPWRKEQSAIRKDFWLDVFYMFFNFFLFSLIGYNALSNIGVALFNDFLSFFGVENMVALNLAELPKWLGLLMAFVIADFIQWNTHRMLHAVPTLWKFHQVHHSVLEMGFAAHLRFHWMETIVYKSIQFIPLTMLGFGLMDLFYVHIITILIGHLNHSNVKLTYGPLKYLINNPVMHLWHHAKAQPPGKVSSNFGISLSLWDYLFGTAYIPNANPDEPLGFEDVEHFPKGFWKQVLEPFKGSSKGN